MRAIALSAAFDGPHRTMSLDESKEEYERRRREENAFWKGPEVDAIVLIELPFWLLMDGGQIEVDFNKTNLIATINQDFLQVSDGITFLDSQNNVIWIGKQSDFRELPSEKVLEMSRSPTFRTMRTVITLPVCVKESIFSVPRWPSQISREDKPLVRSFQRARQYLQSLAFAHVPFINRIIDWYRQASHDPFATELSEFDLTACWIQKGMDVRQVCLMPYWNMDSFPTMYDGDQPQPVVTTKVDDLKSQAKRFSPGQREIHEAVSNMFRGRFSEAIRYSVTAIEVLVEAELRRLHSTDGLSAEQIEAELERTKNSFDSRLDLYERLSGRRIPGPVPSPIHYINGIRLRAALASSRKLRHAIVHHGKRVSILDRGPTLKAVETATWLYQDITGDARFNVTSNETYATYNAFRGQRTYGFDYLPTRVVVLPNDTQDESTGSVVIHREIVFRQYCHSFLGRKRDAELIVAMTLAYLGLDVVDGPYEATPTAFERFVGLGPNGAIAATIIENVSLLTVELIESLKNRAATIASKNSIACSPLIVVADPAIRVCLSECIQVDQSVFAFAKQSMVSILSLQEMFRIGHGIEQLKWSQTQCLHAITNSVGFFPGFYECVGEVLRVFPKQNSIGFVIPALQLQRDDLLSIDCAPWLIEFPIKSLHSSMVPTDLAVGPCEVGVKLPDGLSARKVKIGSKLFRRTDNPSLVENEHLYSRDLFAEFIRSEVESNTGE